MVKEFKKASQEVVDMLTHGKIGVSSTDTIYGVIGSALSKKVIERIYKLKERDPQKPFIILINSYEDLATFEIDLTEKLENFLDKVWPGPVTVILPCDSQRFEYLHRGKESLAFRVPKPRWLRNLIKKTGPLVAPSANKSGLDPALLIEEARMYFADNVDFYLDKGITSETPSLITEVIRK